MNKKLKILLFTETETGCYLYRAKIPGKFLEKRGHEVMTLAANQNIVKMIQAPDVAVFYRGYRGDITGAVNQLKSLGIKIIFDADDAVKKIKKSNPGYHEIAETFQSAEWLARNADVITTTTVILGRYFKQFNPNVAILPNSLDFESWKLRDFGNKRLRIGWSGGGSHCDDLLIILDVIRDLQKKHDFDFVLHGMTSLKTIEDWYNINVHAHGEGFKKSSAGLPIDRVIQKLKAIRYEFHPWVSIDEYPEVLRSLNLDIGLAPLIVNDFNNKKSCLKFYEYAAVGTVTLASNALPYSEEVQYVAKNNYADWYQKLEYLLNHFSENLYEPQRKWVIQNRNAERNVENWEKVYADTAGLSVEVLN